MEGGVHSAPQTVRARTRIRATSALLFGAALAGFLLLPVTAWEEGAFPVQGWVLTWLAGSGLIQQGFGVPLVVVLTVTAAVMIPVAAAIGLVLSIGRGRGAAAARAGLGIAGVLSCAWIAVRIAPIDTGDPVLPGLWVTAALLVAAAAANGMSAVRVGRPQR